MEITADSNMPWSTDDEFHLHSFFQTETGKRFIPKLAEKLPGLLSGGGTNEILIRNGEQRGFQFAITSMLELTHSAPRPMQSEGPAYPALDDDSKWDDGHKLTQ